jgi:phosphoglycolate phosphatase-like HAD superfamily hydrolase
MRYELLVFDWDGTLIDSARTIVVCIPACLENIDELTRWLARNA